MPAPTAVLVARVAEAAYAALALVLALGLQWPPRGAGVVLWAHWLGTAILAATIAVRLGRPNRATWYVAAILSGYVLVNAIAAIVRLVATQAGDPGRPGVAALAVGAVLWTTQLGVAVCLYLARDIRSMGPSPRAPGRRRA